MGVHVQTNPELDRLSPRRMSYSRICWACMHRDRVDNVYYKLVKTVVENYVFHS